MSEIIKAPFTEDQVKKLNEYQRSGKFHPFTGIGQPRIINKLQPAMERTRAICPNNCLLIATVDGWCCPCNDDNCNQNWAWKFMSE